MPPLSPPDAVTAPIPLGPLLAEAARFRALFGDGMRLVEEAAAYLDGPGREEAEDLSPVLAEAYAAESMRLTTRLMQAASWLLIRRAVVDGEAGAAEALQERKRVTLSAQNRVSPPSIFLQLPLTLQRLTERSLRLQRRVMHLDRMIHAETDAPVPAPPAGLTEQYARLRSAFGAA